MIITSASVSCNVFAKKRCRGCRRRGASTPENALADLLIFRRASTVHVKTFTKVQMKRQEISPLGVPNRGAVKALEAVKLDAEARPRLEIVGRSSMEGRAATLMRIRPSLLAEFERLNVVGPQYLIVETALRFLIGHLDGMRPGETLSLDASDMQATPEDHQMLIDSGRVVKKVPRKRPAKSSFLNQEGPRNKSL